MRSSAASDVYKRQTEKSVAEISEMVGYSSPANFSTFIKNVTGKTPSAIRREREKYIYNPE